MAESDFCFTVREGDDLHLIVQVVPHDERAKRYFLSIWHKMLQAAGKYHEFSNEAPIPGWVGWKPHEWCDQVRGNEDRQRYIAWSGDMMVGFLNLRPNRVSAHDPQKKVMYIEHMAAAPGNISTPIWGQRVSYSGLMLLAYSVFQSKHQGFEGLLGLHAADGQALSYYRELNKKRGGGVFLPEKTGVPGFAPRDADLGKVYLETTQAGADSLLEDYRRG